MTGSRGPTRGTLKARVLASCLVAITVVLAVMGGFEYATQRRNLDAALNDSIERA